MSKGISGVLSLFLVFLLAGTLPVQAQSSDAKTLLEQGAKAMGGMQTLRSLKSQVVESASRLLRGYSGLHGGGSDRGRPIHSQGFLYPCGQGAAYGATRQPGEERRAFVIKSYAGRQVLTDGSRQIEIYPLPTSHAEDNQIVYLPREKILIEADHVSPRKNKFRPGPLPNELLKGIDQLKLDVTTIVGIHGDTADIQALRAAAKGGQQ